MYGNQTGARPKEGPNTLGFANNANEYSDDSYTTVSVGDLNLKGVKYVEEPGKAPRLMAPRKLNEPGKGNGKEIVFESRTNKYVIPSKRDLPVNWRETGNNTTTQPKEVALSIASSTETETTIGNAVNELQEAGDKRLERMRQETQKMKEELAKLKEELMEKETILSQAESMSVGKASGTYDQMTEREMISYAKRHAQNGWYNERECVMTHPTEEHVVEVKYPRGPELQRHITDIEKENTETLLKNREFAQTQWQAAPNVGRYKDCMACGAYAPGQSLFVCRECAELNCYDCTPSHIGPCEELVEYELSNGEHDAFQIRQHAEREKLRIELTEAKKNLARLSRPLADQWHVVDQHVKHPFKFINASVDGLQKKMTKFEDKVQKGTLSDRELKFYQAYFKLPGNSRPELYKEVLAAIVISMNVYNNRPFAPDNTKDMQTMKQIENEEKIQEKISTELKNIRTSDVKNAVMEVSETTKWATQLLSKVNWLTVFFVVIGLTGIVLTVLGFVFLMKENHKIEVIYNRATMQMDLWSNKGGEGISDATHPNLRYHQENGGTTTEFMELFTKIHAFNPTVCNDQVYVFRDGPAECEADKKVAQLNVRTCNTFVTDYGIDQREVFEFEPCRHVGFTITAGSEKKDTPVHVGRKILEVQEEKVKFKTTTTEPIFKTVKKTETFNDYFNRTSKFFPTMIYRVVWHVVPTIILLFAIYTAVDGSDNKILGGLFGLFTVITYSTFQLATFWMPNFEICTMFMMNVVIFTPIGWTKTNWLLVLLADIGFFVYCYFVPKINIWYGMSVPTAMATIFISLTILRLLFHMLSKASSEISTRMNFGSGKVEKKTYKGLVYGKETNKSSLGPKLQSAGDFKPSVVKEPTLQVVGINYPHPNLKNNIVMFGKKWVWPFFNITRTLNGLGVIIDTRSDSMIAHATAVNGRWATTWHAIANRGVFGKSKNDRYVYTESTFKIVVPHIIENGAPKEYYPVALCNKLGEYCEIQTTEAPKISHRMAVTTNDAQVMFACYECSNGEYSIGVNPAQIDNKNVVLYTHPGYCGAPYFDQQGRLVGMHYFGSSKSFVNKCIFMSDVMRAMTCVGKVSDNEISAMVSPMGFSTSTLNCNGLEFDGEDQSVDMDPKIKDVKMKFENCKHKLIVNKRNIERFEVAYIQYIKRWINQTFPEVQKQGKTDNYYTTYQHSIKKIAEIDPYTTIHETYEEMTGWKLPSVILQMFLVTLGYATYTNRYCVTELTKAGFSKEEIEEIMENWNGKNKTISEYFAYEEYDFEDLDPRLKKKTVFFDEFLRQVNDGKDIADLMNENLDINGYGKGHGTQDRKKVTFRTQDGYDSQKKRKESPDLQTLDEDEEVDIGNRRGRKAPLGDWRRQDLNNEEFAEFQTQDEDEGIDIGARRRAPKGNWRMQTLDEDEGINVGGMNRRAPKGDWRNQAEGENSTLRKQDISVYLDADWNRHFHEIKRYALDFSEKFPELEHDLLPKIPKIAPFETDVRIDGRRVVLDSAANASLNLKGLMEMDTDSFAALLERVRKETKEWKELAATHPDNYPIRTHNLLSGTLKGMLEQILQLRKTNLNKIQKNQFKAGRMESFSKNLSPGRTVGLTTMAPQTLLYRRK
jgi:hypothetical protein